MPNDHTQHHSGKLAVKAVIQDGDQVLVCRGVGDAVWDFPGGRLHVDESPQAGLVREVREEIGLEIKVGRPIHICRSYHYGSNEWHIFAGFAGTITGSSKIRVDTEEIEECTWMSRKELETLPMFDDCREIADAFLAGP